MTTCKIDDRQPSHAEGHTRFQHYTLIIRTAVRDDPANAIEYARTFFYFARFTNIPEIDVSAYATHSGILGINSCVFRLTRLGFQQMERTFNVHNGGAT